MFIAPRQSSPSRPSTLAPGRHVTTFWGSDMNSNSSSGGASTEISFEKRMPASDHRVAAAHRQRLARHVRRAVRGQEQDRPDDVLRGAEAAQRVRARDLLQRLVIELRTLLALLAPDRALAARLRRAGGEAGADGVERDSVLADFLGDRLGHGDHARLGAGVDGLAPLA